MTNLRIAAQQALEALDAATSYIDGYYVPRGKTTLPEIEEAQKALRAALAQQDEPCPNCASLEAQNTELDRKLAELEQAYENGYKAGVAHERERCLRLIDDHVRAVDSEDVVRAIKEVQG